MAVGCNSPTPRPCWGGCQYPNTNTHRGLKMKQLRSKFTISIETIDSSFSCSVDQLDNITDDVIADDKSLIEFIQQLQNKKTQQNLNCIEVSPAAYSMYTILDDNDNELLRFMFRISKKQKRSKFVDYSLTRWIGNNHQTNTWQEAAE
jgi:hypothetical protein